MNSRNKGKGGELEVAHLLQEAGYPGRRGCQYHGGTDSPDVVGIDGIHIEVKRTERTDIYGWMEQASRDAGENIPAVFHRKNRNEWVVILPVKGFLELVKGWMTWKSVK